MQSLCSCFSEFSIFMFLCFSEFSIFIFMFSEFYANKVLIFEFPVCFRAKIYIVDDDN